MSSFRATLLRVALSVGLSFSLWAFVSFSQNPEESVTFSDLQLEVTGLGEGLVIVDANGLPTQALPQVDVILVTDRRQLAQLRPVDVRAVIDLSNLGPGDHIVPVNVRPTRNNISFTPRLVDPSSVPVRLEQVSVRPVPINLQVQGNLPFSFERGEPSITYGGQPIELVEVRGPLSRVERVIAAVATANIEQLRATYLAPLALTAMDVRGQSVEGVQLTPATVTVEIPIKPVVGLKLVPVQPVVTGLPAPGYAIAGVIVNPPLIAVAGSSGPLDLVDVLRTAPINVSGASAPVEQTVAVIFPEGTSPREGEPDQVRVTVQVAPVSLPLQIRLPAPVTVAGLAAGLQFGVAPPTVELTLAGTSQALATLSQTPLRAVVNVSGLGPGVYRLPVSVELPPGVSLSGPPPDVQVTLRSFPVPTPLPETGSPDVTPSPEPGATPAPGGTPEPGATPEATPTP